MKKTLYILNLALGETMFHSTDKPELIYWNMKKQQEDPTPNKVMTVILFGLSKKAEDAQELIADKSLYPVEIDDFSNMSWDELRKSCKNEAQATYERLEKCEDFKNELMMRDYALMTHAEELFVIEEAEE